MPNSSGCVPRPRGHHAALAVDAGQSSLTMRARVGGRPLQRAVPGILTDRPLIEQLGAAITDFLDDTGAEVSAVGVGSSGLLREGAAELLGVLPAAITEVSLAHDSTTAYLGALGDNPGVVVACGTGVVTLAMGDDSVARVDGWGYLIGDAGSAYWIGRNALEAAMRGYDGRRQMTRLTDVVAADFADIEEAYRELQADPKRVARVASYAAKVDALAADDPVAANILDKAAAHLSEAVITGARRVGLMGHEAPRVCAVGNVFGSTRLVRKFTEFLTLEWPNFALTQPGGTALDGAEALLTLDQSSPLAHRVSQAAR